MRIPLEQADREQLKAFCDLQGLASDGRVGQGKLQALLAQSGYDKDYIELPDDVITPRSRPAVQYDDDSAAVLTSEDRAARDNRKVRITVNSQENGELTVPVGVNGEIMLIPTNRPVVIPWSYFHVMENASQDIYAQTEEGLGEAMPQRAYPFTFHGYVAEK